MSGNYHIDLDKSTRRLGAYKVVRAPKGKAHTVPYIMPCSMGIGASPMKRRAK